MKRLLVLPSQTDGSPCALPVKRADERELWVHVLWEVAMRSSVPGRLMRDWIEDHGNADFLGDWDGANELALIEVCGKQLTNTAGTCPGAGFAFACAHQEWPREMNRASTMCRKLMVSRWCSLL
jgi:hypothetical protein